MRYAGVLFCLVCIGAAQARAESTAQPPFLEFVYIASNIEASSGGHSALKCGEIVYHFQYTPAGLFLLARDPWPQFSYLYNDLENRSMSRVRVPVASAAYESIQQRFTRYYLIQEKHRAYLETLRRNVVLLQSFESPTMAVLLPGVGLFTAEYSNDSYTSELRDLIIDQYGQDFLKTALQQCLAELQSLPLVVRDITVTEPSANDYPATDELYCERYLELCLQAEALKILQQARSLSAGSLLDPGRFAGSSVLSLREQALLTLYSQQLQSTVLQLLSSVRPDRGYPLLLATARYLAIRHSLAAKRLLVLDPFSERAVTVVNPGGNDSQKTLSGLMRRALLEYEDTRQLVFKEDELRERNYNLLETAGGRYHEISRALRENTPVRVETGPCIPSKAGSIATKPPEVKMGELQDAVGRAQANCDFYQKKIIALYNYKLVRKNCATEISRTINDAFLSPQAVSSALGGYLEPGAAMSYIPFRLQQTITKRFNVDDTISLPSYRIRTLRNLYARHNTVATYLRECTSLGSSLYTPHKEDTAFLMFTDDVFWPRPLYGILNIAYGLLHVGAGVFTLPFDRGQRAKAGLRGMLYSIPELFLCNIRKGSFAYLPAPAVQADLTEPTLNRHVAP